MIVFKVLFIIGVAFGVISAILVFTKEIYRSSKAGQASMQRKKEAHGRNWEATCAQQIEKYMKVPALQNILIPARNKIGSTECDIVFVNNKGVFCTECKYKESVKSSNCHIDDKYCTLWDIYDHVIEPKEGEEKPLNPIYQNKGHIKWLKEILPIENVPVYSYIRTNYNFELRYMGKIRKGDQMTPIDLLRSEEQLFIGHPEYLEKAMINIPDVLTDEDVNVVRQAIEFYVATDEEMAEFKARQEEAE